MAAFCLHVAPVTDFTGEHMITAGEHEMVVLLFVQQ